MLALSDNANLQQAVPVLAALCTGALILVAPPRGEPLRFRCLFVGALVAFLLVSLAALMIFPKMPGAGRLHSRDTHVYDVALALTAGLAIRDLATAKRLLAVLLIAFGARYVCEAISLPWREALVWGRLAGCRGLATVFAMELLILFSLFLGSATMPKSKLCALACLLGALLTAALILMTRSLFALLTMALVAVPMALVAQRRVGSRRARLLAALAWLLLLAPVAGLFWWHNTTPERRTAISALVRIEAWHGALRVATKAPWNKALIGHGPYGNIYRATATHYGMGPEDFPQYAAATQPRADGSPPVVHAHNVLLQALLGSGVLGVSALLVIWGAALWSSSKAWLRGPSQEAAFAGILVVSLLTIAAMGQVEYLFFWSAGRLAWFVAGLALASRTWSGAPDAAGV